MQSLGPLLVSIVFYNTGGTPIFAHLQNSLQKPIRNRALFVRQLNTTSAKLESILPGPAILNRHHMALRRQDNKIFDLYCARAAKLLLRRHQNLQSAAPVRQISVQDVKNAVKSCACASGYSSTRHRTASSGNSDRRNVIGRKRFFLCLHVNTHVVKSPMSG